MAHINKPIIAVAPGHAFNSGAALLAACGHPLTTLDAKVGFNEVTFGFVPHSGGSFYMSRMKGEFGTFMALTGLPIHGSDAARMDISRGIVHDTKEYSQEVSDHVSSMPMPFIGGQEMFQRDKGEKNIYTEWKRKQYERYTELNMMENKDITRMGREQKMLGMEDELKELKDRIPSSTAEADFRYMQYIREDAKRK